MAHDLLSLITVLQQDRVHEKALVESLFEKVTSLKNLLEKSVTMQHGGNKDIFQELQSEIRDAAHEAEDIIESRAVDQMLSEPEAVRSAFAMPENSISKVMEKFDAANHKLENFIKLQTSHDEGENTTDVISNPTLTAADDQETNTALVMVGFEEDADHLKGRLIRDRRKREIIPIVGMGGIGKTTLARNLYNDPLVVSHFDVRAWVTVSQDYNVRAILLGLLGSVLEKISEDMLEKNDSVLGETLYRRLYGRRYLVVLDDIWSERAWDEIQRYFPNEESRSRILITSRELHVAKHPDSACEEHQMHLLSDAQGWDLLHRKVFEEGERCPHFLEEIGQKIARVCGGLPLALSVIGGLLYADKYSEDLWVQVARDVRSITGNHISEILCLSYDNLPLHLKPCFLYMSAFPEDYEVPRSRLVKLLVAEGFMWWSNAENDKSLEDVAEEYLKALVDRNLLSVTHKMYDGRAEYYSMHDLLRDLCVRKAEEEKFLRIFNYGKNINSFRRGSAHLLTDQDAPDHSENLSFSRSLFFIRHGIREIDISSILSSLRLVRVLDVSDLRFPDFPTEIIKLANLRCLGISFSGSLPSAIWRLQNLQTLLVNFSRYQSVILPSEAWEISGLRHIVMPNATIYIDFKVSRVHENLQALSGIRLHDLLASNLINNIPNIKELEIHSYEFVVPEDRIIDLSHLHKLETLKLVSFTVPALSIIELPNRLKEISFLRCGLPMGLVNAVGYLQYLQVLKINSCMFTSDEHSREDCWELNEEVEFCSLQFVEIYCSDVRRWKADYSHFPILRHLRILRCYKLEEIPACIAEMSTLEKIVVSKNIPSHVHWANGVQKTQREEYGNETLQICLI